MTPLLLATALLLAPSAEAGPVRGLPKAAAKAKTETLIKALDHKKGYARELAARQLSRLKPTGEGTSALTACVENGNEKGYVRAACAFTLSRWGAKDADKSIINAMEQVDPESRYWMAEALHELDTKAARGHLASLQSDSDIYLAASAREWVQ
jgi:HEAT repeat protein